MRIAGRNDGSWAFWLREISAEGFIVSLGKEFSMVVVRGGGMRRGYVALGEKTRLLCRINLGRRTFDRGFSVAGRSSGRREGEVYGVWKKAAVVVNGFSWLVKWYSMWHNWEL
jgi:hypothetical protein